MKFSAQEEYGLRCLLQIGRQGEGLSCAFAIAYRLRESWRIGPA